MSAVEGGRCAPFGGRSCEKQNLRPGVWGLLVLMSSFGRVSAVGEGNFTRGIVSGAILPSRSIRSRGVLVPSKFALATWLYIQSACFQSSTYFFILDCLFRKHYNQSTSSGSYQEVYSYGVVPKVLLLLLRFDTGNLARTPQVKARVVSNWPSPSSLATCTWPFLRVFSRREVVFSST